MINTRSRLVQAPAFHPVLLFMTVIRGRDRCWGLSLSLDPLQTQYLHHKTNDGSVKSYPYPTTTASTHRTTKWFSTGQQSFDDSKAPSPPPTLFSFLNHPHPNPEPFSHPHTSPTPSPNAHTILQSFPPHLPSETDPIPSPSFPPLPQHLPLLPFPSICPGRPTYGEFLIGREGLLN